MSSAGLGVVVGDNVGSFLPDVSLSLMAGVAAQRGTFRPQ